MDNLEAAQSELRASPLNPNVQTLSKSSKSLSFDVWCFAAGNKCEKDWSENSMDKKNTEQKIRQIICSF